MRILNKKLRNDGRRILLFKRKRTRKRDRISEAASLKYRRRLSDGRTYK